MSLNSKGQNKQNFVLVKTHRVVLKGKISYFKCNSESGKWTPNPTASPISPTTSDRSRVRSDLRVILHSPTTEEHR